MDEAIYLCRFCGKEMNGYDCKCYNGDYPLEICLLCGKMRKLNVDGYCFDCYVNGI